MYCTGVVKVFLMCERCRVCVATIFKEGRFTCKHCGKIIKQPEPPRDDEPGRHIDLIG